MDNTKRVTQVDKESKLQLFVASMLFFIPIGQPCRKYQNAFKASRSEIKAPAYIQNAGFVCNFLDLCSSGLNKTQSFYYEYNRVDGEDIKTIERKITLQPYIFHYNPDKTQKNGTYFLVIRTTVNKKFEDSAPNDFCTETDLVMLRQSLLKSDKEKGAYYPAKDPMIYHREWLNRLVADIEGQYPDEERSKYISFFNSITEISTVSIDKNKQNDFEKEFCEEYYNDVLTEQSYITKDDTRFCYGILTGNENYKRLPDEVVNDVLKKGYSNNITEKTFAATKSIVFFKKHYPFPNVNVTEREPVKPGDLFFLQYIHEMCGCLYIDRQLKRLRNIFQTKRSLSIRKGLSSMAGILGTKLFRITEASHRAEYIAQAFGLKEEYERLKERGNILADSIDIKYSRLNNASIMILTILTVIIGAAQIVLSKTTINSATNYFSDTKTLTTMTQTSLITTNLLLLLILINVVVLTCFVVSHLTRNNRKDNELF